MRTNLAFPDEIKEAVVAISHPTRWCIIELLQVNNRLAYTELLNSLNTSKGLLNHHLNKLTEAGLVDNYAQGEFGSQYSSYYSLSRFGKDFTDGLLSSVEEISVIDSSKKQVSTAETIFKPQYAFNTYSDIFETIKNAPATNHLLKEKFSKPKTKCSEKYFGAVRTIVNRKPIYHRG